MKKCEVYHPTTLVALRNACMYRRTKLRISPLRLNAVGIYNRELKQPRRRRWVRRQVKNEFIFYERNSQLSRSVRFVNGSKIVLELNVQWRRVIPNGNTKY